MSDRRRGLGRGLEALIPSTPPAAAEASPPQLPPAARAATRVDPLDVFFPERTPFPRAPDRTEDPEEPEAPDPAAAPDPVAATTDAAPDDAATGDAGTGSGAASPGAGAPARYAELPVEVIAPNPRQPRQVFDEEALAELAHSIREVGLLQPVVVRGVGDGRYELVMGERRWRAAQAAGLASVPAIVRSTGDDDLLRDALLENLHRAQLNPLEEAAAYDQLLADFGCTHEELSARLGRSRPQVTNTLRLLRLPVSVQRRLAAGVLSAGHARALLSLEDPDAQDRLAERIVAEGLSVRAVEEVVAVGAAPVRASRRVQLPRVPAPQLEHVAARLADRFETRVRVDLGRRRGRIVVEFASLEDLERIIRAMGPNLADDEGDAVGQGVQSGPPVGTVDHPAP